MCTLTQASQLSASATWFRCRDLLRWVRLHPQKNFRELDAGELHIGGKFEEAEKSDLIPVNVSRPESTVWLVQPQQVLQPDEYALMLGAQNLSIFTFTVDAVSGQSPSSPKN